MFEVDQDELVELTEHILQLDDHLDRYFTGWLDPKLKLFDNAVLADLLIAYIDDADAVGDTEAPRILYRREKAD
jgi:hypothetical protein